MECYTPCSGRTSVYVELTLYSFYVFYTSPIFYYLFIFLILTTDWAERCSSAHSWSPFSLRMVQRCTLECWRSPQLLAQSYWRPSDSSEAARGKPKFTSMIIIKCHDSMIHSIIKDWPKPPIYQYSTHPFLPCVQTLWTLSDPLFSPVPSLLQIFFEHLHTVFNPIVSLHQPFKHFIARIINFLCLCSLHTPYFCIIQCCYLILYQLLLSTHSWAVHDLNPSFKPPMYL